MCKGRLPRLPQMFWLLFGTDPGATLDLCDSIRCNFTICNAPAAPLNLYSDLFHLPSVYQSRSIYTPAPPCACVRAHL